MHLALYRKWRSRTFDEVFGQEQVTDILKYQVAQQKTTHAYLFCGSRGTGKTSCAKILAKAVNCEDPQNGNPCNACAACRAIDAGTVTDVIEMDAASNTGVDNVRDIKDEIIYMPAELRYRVYIIDEVHMMSGSAFNALLKTLEEPPAHVIFILATTELQKLPSTIISRCQRFDFRRLSTPVIVERLMQISRAEGIDLQEDAARILARMALGGMRDAISLLELCAGSHRAIDTALVYEVLGAGNRATIEKLIQAVVERDYSTIYTMIADEAMSSRDLQVFWRDLLAYYRDMLVVKNVPDAKEYLDLTEEEMETLRQLAGRFSMSLLLYHCRLLEDAQASMARADVSRRTVAELTLTRLCEPKLSDTVESLLARLDVLEGEVSRLKYRAPVQTADAAAPAVEMVEAVAPAVAPPAVTEQKEPGNDPAHSFRLLTSWSEVIGRVVKTHPGVQGFLDTARAYRSEDGRAYVVRASSPFSVKMLTRPDTELTLKAALVEEEGCDLSRCSFKIISEEDRDRRDQFIEEIQDALQ